MSFQDAAATGTFYTGDDAIKKVIVPMGALHLAEALMTACSPSNATHAQST